jgi:3-oxoacyl-[acyl-carrier protein] reductase
VESAGSVAIVTGGARGIGLAISRRLCTDGYQVAIVDKDEAAAKAGADSIREEGGACEALYGDVTSQTSVKDLVDEVVERLGSPAVLVNNAGILRDNLLFRMSEDDWDQVIDVHLKGSFLMARACQAFMVEQGWGRIVNVSSTSALGNRGQANYSTAKAGLQGFTKTLAIELGRFGITCNSIAPGFIVSDMTRATASRLGVEFDEYVEERAAAIPVGRAGVPEDIASLASYLVSTESSFVTGQIIYAAGGPKA